MIYLNIATEDVLSEVVLKRIISDFPDKYQIAGNFGKTGNGYLRKGLKGFNNASIHSPFLILTDLDYFECPVALIENWFKFEKNPNRIFRIAVREVESWLLADYKNLSKYLNISPDKIDKNPEKIIKPKNEIIKLAKLSRNKSIRDDLVPIDNFASIGPNYNSRLSDFVLNHWNIDYAQKNSDSLLRTINYLSCFSNFK